MLKVMHDEGILEKKELGVWKINSCLLYTSDAADE